MADLSTKYLGLNLRSPIVASSGPYSEDISSIQRIEQAGAGALVLFSLFEEQVELDALGYGKYYQQHRGELPEALRHIPNMAEYNHGAGGYLAHLYQAKRAVSIPIIASLNGYYRSGWTRYAKLLEAAGADAIELNIYYMPTKVQTTSAEVEDMYVDLVKEVCGSVHIPVAVKLSPYFSAMAHIADRLVRSGASGLVLFNRFYQPDFDIEEGTIRPSLDLSIPAELRLRLRWVALLAGQTKADLAITGGVHSGTDVVKSLMAGANVAMMASAILKHGIDHVAAVLGELDNWLDSHGHATSNEIRGKLSQVQIGDSAALERANYLNVLLSQRTKTSS
jgi:dihydroorotate dehydrogenase (fumarate)